MPRPPLSTSASVLALIISGLTTIPAHAQNITDTNPSIGDEIVVTGERLKSTVYETGSSVTVTTMEELELFAGSDTLARILEQTPNVSSTGEGNQGPTIRGANTSGILTSVESFFGGSQPRTTVQVDGRQLSFNEFVFSGQSAWDIERVEVFRGPQTTTQGRNAISGAVFIETARPELGNSSARVRLRGGNNHLRQLSGTFNGAMGEDVALRLSGDYLGFESDVDRPNVTGDPGVSFDRQEVLSLRGRLLWEPSTVAGLSTLLTVSHSDTSRPQTDSIGQPFEDRINTNANPSVFTTNTDAAALDVTYVSGDWTLRNTATASQSDVARQVEPSGFGLAGIDNDTLTNEFTLTYDGGPLTALTGLYLSKIKSDDSLDLAGFGIGVGAFKEDRDSFGVFGQASYDITNRAEATVGLRYQRDSQNRTGGFGDVIPIEFDETFDAWLPRAELAYEVSDNVRVGVMAERGYNAGGFTFNFDTFTSETFTDETVWNYEAFARTRLMDGRLRVNANIFYSDFDDLQIASLVELGEDFFANVFSNAPSARTIGAEVDLDYRASEDIQIMAGLGYANTKYTSDSVAGAPLDGNAFQRSPEVTLTGGIAWTPGQFDVSAFGRYSDGYFSDDENRKSNQINNFVTVDLQAGYSLSDDIRIYAEAVNALDDNSPVFISSNGTSAALQNARQFALGLELGF